MVYCYFRRYIYSALEYWIYRSSLRDALLRAVHFFSPSLWWRFALYAAIRLFFAHSDATHMEHRMILDGIVRKDTRQAELALEGHIRRTRITLSQHRELFS